MELEVNDITLNYIKEGQGVPLILLHGNGEDHSIFDKLTEKLKRYFTVYAIDSRNHGGSSKTDDYSYETMAEDIFQFITTSKLENPLILGFSDGAIISLLLELRHKDIFRKMIWLGINLKPSDFKQEIYDDILSEYEQTKDPLIKMMLNEPQIELESLASIETETLVIAGENDIFKKEVAQSIVSTMPNASLKVIIGHDHSSYIINEDILYPDIKQFLQKD